ncbi:MAG: hypothetical protein GF368_01705 [Candidatus Aenigmarchaeota archaeon]|nr:hypothetical protein [Candidatus Aenigmarchaeota archaeon]
MKKILFICLVSFLIPLAFALDSIEEDGVTLSLVKDGNDYWTVSSTQELFNFTVENGNNGYNISEINITVPDQFTFSNDTLSSNWSSWDCEYIEPKVTCNSSEDLLDVGEVIEIWFSASADLENEINVTWFVDLLNISNELEVSITTGIDGKPPQINEINMTYMGSDLEDSGNISGREPIGLDISVSDGGIGTDKAWVHVVNSTDDTVQEISLNGDGIFSGEVNTESLDDGDYTIKVFSNDSFGNLNDSEEVGFIVNPLPDFEVSSFSWSPTNPSSGDNLTVFSNVAAVNSIDQNVSLVWKLDGTLICEELVDSAKEVNCTFTGFSGSGNVSVEVDSDDNLTESSENNNYHSRIFSTDLNVTILNVLYDSESYNSSDLAFPKYNETLILNVSVNYWNDQEVVTDLDLDDFEIYDKWVSGSGNYEIKENELSNVDSSMSTSGVYLITYRTLGISGKTLEYGNHRLKIKLNDSGHLGESDEWDYFLDGPSLVITFPEMESSVDLNGASSKDVTFDINVTNQGNYTISNVQLVLIDANKGATIPESKIEDCKDEIGTLGPGKSLICEGLKVEVRESGTRVTVLFNGTYESNLLEYEEDSHSISVSDSGDSDDGNDGQEGGQEADDEQWEDESPSSGGGFSVTPKSLKSEDYLKITTYPEKVELEQGKRITKIVEVKNVHDIEFQNVKLKITGINSSWVTILPSGDVELEPLKPKEYRVVFDIPSDGEIKDYEAEFEASSSFKTKKQSFTLTVLPGPELQSTIDQTIEDCQKQIAQLEKEIEEKKSKGYDTTEAENKLQKLKEEFNKMLSYRDGGNYKSAYDLMDETENLIEETTNILSGAVALSTSGSLTGLLTGIEMRWLLPGLFGLLLLVGGYTWWGRHFKLKEKLLGKLNLKKPKFRGTGREKELDMLASKIKKKDTKPVKTKKKIKIDDSVIGNTEISERTKELDLIKNLVKGK